MDAKIWYNDGYVVQVGSNQWSTGFETLAEAHNFAIAKGATEVYIPGGVPIVRDGHVAGTRW